MAVTYSLHIDWQDIPLPINETNALRHNFNIITDEWKSYNWNYFKRHELLDIDFAL